MSRHLAQIGVPGQVLDVLAGGDVDTAGRLLSVAELQTALNLALQRSRPDADQRTAGPGHDRGTSPAGDSPMQSAPVAASPADGIARPGHAGGPDQEPPPGPARDCGGPDPSTPATTSAAAVDAADGDAAGAPPAGERAPEWGANPVPVTARPGERPVRVPPAAPPTLPPGSGRYRFPVSELLRRRPGDRDRRAAQVLAGGWPGPRRVVLGSLTGGAGRSTTAAVICAAAGAAGVPVLALDATGGDDGELAARVGGGAAAGRDWTRLTGREAEVDFTALRRRADAGSEAAGAQVAVITVGGDAGSPPPAEAVAAGASAAATAWPLVLVDIPHGHAATGAAVRAGGIDLLVLVCRADPAEIADSCEFLAEVTAAAGGMDCAQRAVVAVRADRRGPTGAARRALAAVAGVAAGPVPVPYVARLTGRRAAAHGPDAEAAGRLLLAAAALTPPATPPVTFPSRRPLRSSE